MARKPTPAATPVDASIDEQALQRAGQAATELVVHNEQLEIRVRAVALQIGYHLPADAVDPDLIQRDISANMRRSVEACLEVGRGLCVLKEAAGHGAFAARLDVLGIEPRVAQRFMASAIKFSNTTTSSLLKAAGNSSKLFELLVLDDEQVEELALTGQTGELALDDIATMSVKELRAALREAKEAATAKDRVISTQSDKINDLSQKLERPYKPKKGQPARSAEDEAALSELIEATNAVDVNFARLGAVVSDLQEHESEPMRERALQSVTYLIGRVREIVLQHGLEVQVDDESLVGRPDWLGSTAN